MDEAFKALREQFCPDSFRIIMHERLFRESQKANESLDTYIQRFNRMVSVLDHTEEQRVVLFISNLQPHLKQYLMTQRPKRMQEAIELGKLQEAATKCTNDAWPAQISKLQTLLEAQEAKIN